MSQSQWLHANFKGPWRITWPFRFVYVRTFLFIFPEYCVTHTEQEQSHD